MDSLVQMELVEQAIVLRGMEVAIRVTALILVGTLLVLLVILPVKVEWLVTMPLLVRHSVILVILHKAVAQVNVLARETVHLHKGTVVALVMALIVIVLVVGGLPILVRVVVEGAMVVTVV